MRHTGAREAHNETRVAPRCAAVETLHKYLFLNIYLMNYFTFSGKYV